MGGRGQGGTVTFPSLRRRLYLLAWIDEFGPIYAVYTLWFNDNGVSTAEISTAFLLWAVVALVLEIPSGALADRVDRRRLLAVAFGIRAGGLSLWLLWPTFTGLLVGAALWATHDSLASGAWEAMIHDELTAIDEGDRYQTVMARLSQFSHVGVATGTLLGAALLRDDVGLDVLGWVTVAAHAGSISLVLALPDVRWVARQAQPTPGPATRPHDVGASPVADTFLSDVGADDATSYRAWWATLRPVWRRPVARRCSLGWSSSGRCSKACSSWTSTSRCSRAPAAVPTSRHRSSCSSSGSDCCSAARSRRGDRTCPADSSASG